MSNPADIWTKKNKRTLDEYTTRKGMGFLFDRGELTENQYLDTRTEISTRDMFGALGYYRVIEEGYDCKEAGVIADVLERLLESSNRLSRKEAAWVLGQLPPEVVKDLEAVVKEKNGNVKSDGEAK